MDKSHKNKENIVRNGCISNMFRVKKCLFDQTISSKDKELKSPNADEQRNVGSPMVITSYFESCSYSLNDVKRRKSNDKTKDKKLKSPNADQQCNAGSPMLITSYFESCSYSLNDVKKRKSNGETKSKESSPVPSQLQFLADSPMALSPPCVEDSPYSLFKVKKKSAVKSKIAFCTDYSASGSIATTPTNKKCTDEKHVTKKEEILSCYQQSPNTVKLAVQRSMCDPNLTGDFSKHCILPTIEGRHPDLKTVSPALVASLLSEPTSFQFTLIDCRYPYEFEGGHIQDAENIYMKEDIIKRLTEATASSERKESKEVLIFYCEFSSERGPSMLRHLRNTDRDMNRDYYPFLYFPELYVMEGGYKAFFSNFKDLCYPPEYKRMLDKDCADQLAFYKSKCKSSIRSSKRLKRTRSSLVF